MIRADKEQIAIGSDLQNYRIEGVLGQGGFGITYRAVDTDDRKAVAIKEYFPRSMAVRDPNGMVRPKSDSEEDKRMFAWGLERFRKEILTLAKFTHENIVPILYFFETLGTVYMVMPFVEGDSLKAHVKKERGMTEERLLNIVVPLLSGLEIMHKVGFLHRDIKPDNIFIQHHNGQPLLLDFGATRQAMGGAASMTVVMTPEYAPMEQSNADSSKQGPWTDIFSMGAVMYWAVTDLKPLSAATRATAILSQEPDPMPPVAQVAKGQYSERVLRAIDHAIKISANDRPQSIAEWREEMVGAPSAAPPLRGLRGRVTQIAGRRTVIPAFDRSALRSGNAAYPSRTGESQVANESALRDNPPAAVPDDVPPPPAREPAPDNTVSNDSQSFPSMSPAMSVRGAPLQRPPIGARAAGGDSVMIPRASPTRIVMGRPISGVAAEPPPPSTNERFVDNGNGTITDRKYKLIGLKNVKCFGRKPWSEALSAVRDLTTGACGLTDGSHNGDWRLPTRDELPILAEWKESDEFPGVPPFDDFWSRDVYADNTADAWFISIDSGRVDHGAKWVENRFWPVRTARR
ncbi:MAG: protein kinase [Magnetococcales bacterium]|nr:protein kinase [Magnetococcales bacterium]